MSLRPPKRWIIAPEMTPVARRALADFHPILGQILFNRGLADGALARAFLDGEYTRPSEPLLMTGMREALERLRRAIRSRESIAVYGDYDTDGVTATALLVTVLASLGADVRPYIPNRFDEGYGLNTEALSLLKSAGVALVVTVDCGVRSLEEADHARRIGLDLIISDHHHVGAELPRALAVINPKQPGDEYPEKDLAGVGLAYKIAQALLRAESGGVAEESLLDLVALGTVADLAPLTGENRALVRRGLKALNAPQREGLKSLIAVSRARPGQIDAGTVGFALGPRLNAAGRLDSAMAAYKLLMTVDDGSAKKLAKELEEQNEKRRRLTAEVYEQARLVAGADASDPLPSFLFAARDDTNGAEGRLLGVVGLVAARLVEDFYRPAAVVAIGQPDPDKVRGSARSIPDYNITEALDRCADLLVQHGGHLAAAGFTALTGNVEPLGEALRQDAAIMLADKELMPKLTVFRLDHLRDVIENFHDLRKLEPQGYANPQPIFALMAAKPKAESVRMVGSAGDHLKFVLQDAKNATVDVIAFRFGEWFGRLSKQPEDVDIAFTVEMNEWNGERRIQLNVKDIRLHIG